MTNTKHTMDGMDEARMNATIIIIDNILLLMFTLLTTSIISYIFEEQYMCKNERPVYHADPCKDEYRP